MADKEKTRITNFIKKQIEIDSANIREVADNFRKLDEIMKLAKKEMDFLKGILIENQAQEFFPEDEQKVVYQEGRQKTYLDTQKVYEALGIENFIEVATVTETAIKSFATLSAGEQMTVIGQAKVTLEEKTAPSIKVGKMTKTELQEASK